MFGIRFQRGRKKRAKNQISDEYLLTFDFYSSSRGEELLQICQGEGEKWYTNHTFGVWRQFCNKNIDRRAGW